MTNQLKARQEVFQFGAITVSPSKASYNAGNTFDVCIGAEYRGRIHKMAEGRWTASRTAIGDIFSTMQKAAESAAK